MNEAQNNVKERPMLFGAPMVRALLAGTKTQTRRIVKDQPSENSGIEIMHNGTSFAAYDLSDWVTDTYQGYGFQTDDEMWHCPYGQPGDRLWVRETFGLAYPDGDDDFEDWFNTPENKIPKKLPKGWQWTYRADRHWMDDTSVIWKPSIHMPRDASRLLLEITAVRVERVQSISEANAVAEGIEVQHFIPYEVPEPIYKCYLSKKGDVGFGNPVASYESLWASINGPESWATNPWVWVVEFKVIAGGKEVASA